MHHLSEQFPHTNTGVYTLDDAVCYRLGIMQIGADPLLTGADSTRRSEPDVGD